MSNNCSHCQAVKDANSLRKTIRQQKETIVELQKQLRELTDAIVKLSTMVHTEGLQTTHLSSHINSSNSSSNIPSPHRNDHKKRRKGRR